VSALRFSPERRSENLLLRVPALAEQLGQGRAKLSCTRRWLSLADQVVVLGGLPDATVEAIELPLGVAGLRVT